MSIAEKLQTIAENQKKVYDAGFTAGQAAGGDTDAAYNEGYDAGKQAEYDAFWDAFQENGNKTMYMYAFAGPGWTIDNFRPKYDIRPTRAENMFAETRSLIDTDLKVILKNAGIVLDTSQCTTFSNFLMYASPAYLPTIDTTSASNLNNMFSNCSVKEIEKLILKDDGSQTVLNMFYICNNITDIKEIDGVIGTSMNLSASAKLSALTITNVVNALSVNTTGTTLQLSKEAVNAAFTTDEWNALVATKPNWTITLA